MSPHCDRAAVKSEKSSKILNIPRGKFVFHYFVYRLDKLDKGGKMTWCWTSPWQTSVHMVLLCGLNFLLNTSSFINSTVQFTNLSIYLHIDYFFLKWVCVQQRQSVDIGGYISYYEDRLFFFQNHKKTEINFKKSCFVLCVFLLWLIILSKIFVPFRHFVLTSLHLNSKVCYCYDSSNHFLLQRWRCRCVTVTRPEKPSIVARR